MFLNKDNAIKWKRLAIAAVIVLLLCVVGVLWLDKSLYQFMRQFDWKIWGVFDGLFATKVWMFVTFLGGVIIYTVNCVKTKDCGLRFFKKFKLCEIIAKIKEKTKDNIPFLMFYSITLGSAVGAVLKYGIGRARPVFFEALGHTGFESGTAEWAFNSMPSGHSISSFAALVTLGILSPKWKWATWTFAIIIGVSRICFGAHWPSDVILGAFIGMVSADLVISYFKRS